MDVEADAARERVPQILHEVAASERSIVCGRDECEAALRWAQAQPYWPDLPESNLPLYVLET